MRKQHPPQPQKHGSPSAQAPHSVLRPKITHSSKTPRNVYIRPSLCKTFIVVAEEYSVPLSDVTGFIPMDRRCLVRSTNGHTAQRILLVHGFASNRSMFYIGEAKERAAHPSLNISLLVVSTVTRLILGYP